MFAVTLILLYVLLTIPTQHSKSWTHQQLVQQLLNDKLHPAGRRPICLPICNAKSKYFLLLLITLKWRHRNKPRTAKKRNCTLSLWSMRASSHMELSRSVLRRVQHLAPQSCIELCSKDYELLEKSNVQWICKCESMNISSFTFRSYELETSNIYEQITGLDSTMDSISSVFSPLKSSSPKGEICHHTARHDHP
ncbi:unnamed protein product [Mytilus edulis]|uniref:Uncharacterized protein n=1 Tax=Mytilus edulis TaxID=6550 RepID=A0A8S3THY4_MYTED|nr:unnamed protein product [Mytilus edulis]